MSLLLLIMKADYKKLITCIKEKYDLIIDQIWPHNRSNKKNFLICIAQSMSVNGNNVSLPCKSCIFL